MTNLQHKGNLFWVAYQYLALVCIPGTFFVICLGWLPFALLLAIILPRRLGLRWGRHMIQDGFKTYIDVLSLFFCCRFDLSELDQLQNEGPLIIAANHPSLLDAVLIVSRLPKAVCVMKAALMDNIFFGAATRLAGYIRNFPSLAMILNAREALQDGAQLVIFPEGTRTEKFPVDACTASTGLIASRTGIPVQTLLIEYSTPFFGKAWPRFRPPVLPLHCRIRLGRRFVPGRDVGAFTAELDAYFRAELSKNLPSTAAIVS